MAELIVVALGGYLLGSISGALLLGRLRGVDIRTMGSGNAGGTNALRTVGWRFAGAVILIDVGKGAIAAGLLPQIGPWLSDDPLDFSSLAAAGGFMAVIGHVWPVFFRFHGGKGAGTALGVLAVAAPWCLLPLLVVWLATLIGSGYVGLATMLAGLSLVPSMWVFGPSPLPLALGALAIAMAVLLIFTHRSNLSRMRAGDENRFERAQLLKRR